MRSAGIGWAATHFALTKPLKSVQALMLLSISRTSNAVEGAANALVPSVIATASAKGFAKRCFMDGFLRWAHPATRASQNSA